MKIDICSYLNGISLEALLERDAERDSLKNVNDISLERESTERRHQMRYCLDMITFQINS